MGGCHSNWGSEDGMFPLQINCFGKKYNDQKENHKMLWANILNGIHIFGLV